MTTLISKEKNLYMVFNTKHEALDFAFEHLTKNICEDIVVKFNGDRRFVVVCVYEHKTKL